MKTEDLIRQQRRGDPQAVSRALQETAPLHCTVVDSHGKPVPLSSAGYVLRPGRSYRVRVVSPFADRELKGVQIINVPDLISVDPEIMEAEEGKPVRSLPFRVRGSSLSQVGKLRLFHIQCEELEIAHYFQPGHEREVPAFVCPIVVRTHWPIFVVAIVIGLIVTLLERIATEVILSGHAPSGGARGLLQRVFTDLDSWLLLLGLAAGIVILAWGINAYVLHRRSRELRNEFREAYPFN